MTGTRIGDLVRRCAQRRPDSVAYIYRHGESVTWLEFNRRVNRIANALVDAGCGPGDVVASLTADGPVLNEVFFALAKIGAVRVGINYRYSRHEVLSLLSHAGARWVIAEDRFTELVQGSDARVISCGDGQTRLGEYATLAAGAVATEPSADVDEDSLAAICYTTGSTGNPKGAMWSHRNVVEAATHTALDAGMRAGDVWLHCLPGAGVPGILAMWNAVLGWCNVILPQFNASEVLDSISNHGVTSTVWVPTMLLAVVQEQTRSPRDVGSVRKVVYGSAPTTPALIRRARETFPGAQLEQWYGATEGAGGWFTRLSDQDHAAALAGEEELLTSCGRAMHHVDVEIHDEEGRPLGTDQIGEVCIRGSFVMSGYFREPELTASRLDSGWLRTGDMGRMDERGYVYLVDRKEFVIITGGYNVYPIEVENALAEHPAVAQAAVVGAPDDRWGEVVRAYVTLSDGAEATAGELQEICRSRLAAFKVPKQIIFRDELPKGATGKVLKRKLRDEAREEGSAGLI